MIVDKTRRRKVICVCRHSSEASDVENDAILNATRTLVGEKNCLAD